MNEISNFCSGECNSSHSHRKALRLNASQKKSRVLRSGVQFDPNDPPYHIHNQGSQNVPLNSKTLDMDAQHYGAVLEYNAHNLYGELHSCVWQTPRVVYQRLLPQPKLHGVSSKIMQHSLPQD